MINKYLPFIVFILLCSPIPTLAGSFTIFPSSFNISLTTNETKIIPVNITNINQEKTFYNLSLITTSDVKLDQIDSIATNQTITTNLIIDTSSVYHSLLTPTLRGYYLSTISYTPKIYYINISDGGFTPNTLIIKQTDTVIWKNIGTVSHTVTEQSLTWDSGDIPVNGTYSRTFNAIETVNYFDTVTSQGGIIYSQSNLNQELTYNTNYDSIFSLEITSTYPTSNIEFKTLTNNLTINHYDVLEGILSVENKGSELARNLTLVSDDWISFNKNNFNLQPGSLSYITITIQPKNMTTDKTNKTYTHQINLTGSNIASRSLTIETFVPYAEITNGTSPDQVFKLWEEIVKFCNEHPELCSENQTNGSIIYRDKYYNISLSSEEIHDLVIENQSKTDYLARAENDKKETNDRLDIYENKTNTIFGKLGSDIDYLKEKTSSSSFWFFIFELFVLGIVLTVGILYGIVYIKKKTRSNQLSEEGL